VKSLESTLEESIAREEQALQREEAPIDPASADVAGLQRALRESQVKSEASSAGHCGIKLVLTIVQGELERLRKKMSEAEQKSNKTILEVWWQTLDIVVAYISCSSTKRLVTLRVWSKPKYVHGKYRPHVRLTTWRRSIERSAGRFLGSFALLTHQFFQDDLEREIERLRGKLSRAESKKSSKMDGAEKEKQQEREKRPPLPPIMTTAPLESEVSATICEICEQPGHDLFSCPILKDDDSSAAKPNASSPKEYCEDCESYGHTSRCRSSVFFDGTNARDSCDLSALSRCILASRTSHSLLIPLSRRSRSQFVDRSIRLPTHSLAFFRIILFDDLVTFHSTLYCLLFLRYVANICSPLVPDTINAFPSISTRGQRCRRLRGM
jgi:hypothetical protein